MSTVAAIKTEFKELSLPAKVPCRPSLTCLVTVLSDLLALALSTGLALAFAYLVQRPASLAIYGRLWPLAAIFPAVYALFGLYPGIAVNPVDELRRTFNATALVYLMAGVLGFVINRNEQYSPLVYGLGWIITVVMVPVSRSLTRQLFASRSWWGYAVMVVGCRDAAGSLTRLLREQPEIGLRPVVTMDEAQDPDNLDDAAWLSRCGVTHALIVQRGISRGRLTSLLEAHANLFPHVLIIPELGEFSSVALQTRDVGEFLTLEFRNNLLMLGPQLVKRVTDVALCLAGGALALPLILLIALLIKLDSRGSVFYGCTRIGKHKRRFRMWKFRSMFVNGNQLLTDYFDKSPGKITELEQNVKLKRDPRITRIGKILRKTSLDELPQLWNVLKGDMSLVGPRPILEVEVPKYGDQMNLYSLVTPGLTGMWQVSGRNDCVYSDRLKLNSYYVRNWSLWLDLYLVAKTVPVVLQRRGAY
jgi:Undecaprenyl-phosphate galactose phosphotransferase WbaP